MSATNIRAALSARYSSPEWATFFEVSNETGFGKSRAADAVAMNCWPSRGLALHGFEIKVSRGDWLREKKAPEKAEAIARFCNFWWLVSSDAEIVQAGELPEAWGHLTMKGKKLVQVKDAPRREDAVLSRGFIASLLRSASERFVDKAVVAERVASEIHERMERQRNREGIDLDMAKKELCALQARVHAFEQASGVHIDSWQGQKVLGDAVRFVLDGGIGNRERELRRLKEAAEQIASSVAGVLAASEALKAGAVSEVA